MCASIHTLEYNPPPVGPPPPLPDPLPLYQTPLPLCQTPSPLCWTLLPLCWTPLPPLTDPPSPSAIPPSPSALGWEQQHPVLKKQNGYTLIVKVGLLPPSFFVPFTNSNFFNFQFFFFFLKCTIANGGLHDHPGPFTGLTCCSKHNAQVICGQFEERLFPFFPF